MKNDLCEKCGVGIEEASGGCDKKDCPLKCTAVLHGWISVKDRLPSEQDLYLCCGKTIDWNMGKIPDIIFTAYFYLPCHIYDYPRWYERTRSYEDVTIEYWMSLPELPK